MFTLHLSSSNFPSFVEFLFEDAYIFILQWTQVNCVQISRACFILLASSFILLVWPPKFQFFKYQLYFFHSFYFAALYLFFIFICYDYSSVSKSSSLRTSTLRSFIRKSFKSVIKLSNN